MKILDFLKPKRKIRAFEVFNHEVILSSRFYQIAAKNRNKADKINDYLIEEGFLDKLVQLND